MAGRVGRSLQLSPEGKEKAQKALTDRCLTQNELAKELKTSRETVSKFFRGKLVDRQYFVKICEELGLEWDEIVAKSASQPAQEKKQQDSALDIDALVQEVREKRHEKIQDQCGTMRMLYISQPVALADIYTDVNILEEITSQQWREISDLARHFNPELDNFNRLGLGEVRQQRVPGLDAVSRYSKLMVLGKPGAGKTTFLRWVAIKCNLGEFQSNRVPIFIWLKNFAEDTRTDDSESRLLNYIIKEFRRCGIADKSVIETILTEGRTIMLFDGLDEVSEEDADDVVRQIRRFAEDYFKNQYIITCRIAAQKSVFQGFTDVEVADFNSEQVEAFTKKWFVAVAKNDGKEGEGTARRFIDKLNLPENQQIKELVVTPILLNLTCLVFQTKGEFPSKRFKLYEQGLDVLLIKWDEEKGIKRDEVYQNLSLEDKIELLSQVAAITFEKNRYFFEQGEVEQYIAEYLSSLPDAQTDLTRLQRDSTVVLKSIVSQHGLLVERAREIYSFSHLTFQEYLTARHFVTSSEPQAKRLIRYITETRWRQVFLLALSMPWNSDSLLLLKQQIDELSAGEEKLQQFLSWARSYSFCPPLVYIPVVCSCKSLVLRAFYLELVLDLELALDREHHLIHQVFALTSTVDLNLACSLDLNRAVARVINCAYSLDTTIYFEMDIVLHLIRGRTDELKQSFQNLKRQLPNPSVDSLIFKQWWQVKGQNWTKQLKTVMIQYCNIGHDWQFSKQQKKLLQQYYDANELLVKCLNNSEVSHEVRQEIEDTLLLPIAEIEKRQQRVL
ncbi:hypothetical protein SAMD00079811_74610 [Scytonema sp. HK-05]|uniref:NACHT domain-containing protein n=1 Tax=Scytonema sp. HK-05 TaxID=1137095 RepID=UPI000937124D|nr:NACHT domain-containing NTPase [Scytonema sp. HK-05]OKH52061.1 hypothetical protein NIES2130_32555 [Scytonema sp. HK-05]BAY49832.1 hypothetical protein SAMD00079811_74610 [Scytonema sp. HK-05]